MKLRRTLMTALATAGVLVMLAGCSAPAPTLPPASNGSQAGDPSASPDPNATTPAEVEPAAPVQPGTATISADAIDSRGYQRFDVLEADVLEAVGALPDAPRRDSNGNATAIVAIEEAGGAKPTDEYLLNLSYKMCADVMSLTSQNVSLADAITRVMSELPATVGLANADEAALVSAYASAMGTGYSYLCVPLMDEKARQDLEQGVYRG